LSCADITDKLRIDLKVMPENLPDSILADLRLCGFKFDEPQSADIADMPPSGESEWDDVTLRVAQLLPTYFGF
jgi:hypothetical protein